MSVRSITIEFDPERRRSYSDEFLAQLWHTAQANPAPVGDQVAGETVAYIGAEIVRRWLTAIEPSLHAHREADFYWKTLAEHGKWESLPSGGKRWTPDAAIPAQGDNP